MIWFLIIVFVLGYLMITLEHVIKLNKTATALVTAVILWTGYALYNPSISVLSSENYLKFINIHPEGNYSHFVGYELSHHLAKVAEIIFFLLGAMVIVELIDVHQGFKVITNRIKTKDSKKLFWLVTIITFFMSAVLDNLTTAIVMVSLLKRVVHEKEQRMVFAGMVVIAANAGGAWSPIGDVTTTMLWNGGQVTTVELIKFLVLPSIICVLVPAIFMSRKMKGEIKQDYSYNFEKAKQIEKIKGSRTMLVAGISALLFVPIFKTVTHLPPYLGMMLALGLVWIISELIHIDEDEEHKKNYSAAHALSKIDSSSVLFFLGILLAVSCLESTHVLTRFAEFMNDTIGNENLIAIAIGLASAVVDNVPLVAASQGMYDMKTYVQDSNIWHLIAYCAGTGGSILIIGSASGVAVMGMEKIDFMWYLKKIALYAFIGFIAGAGLLILILQLR